MEDLRIKCISFDTGSKLILVQTESGRQFSLGFTKEGYFDIILQLSKRQHQSTAYLSAADFDEALSSLKSRIENRPKQKFGEYGLTESFGSFEEYWRSRFSNRKKKYTIIKEKPDSFSDRDVDRYLLQNQLFQYKGSKSSFHFRLGSSRITDSPSSLISLSRISVTASSPMTSCFFLIRIWCASSMTMACLNCSLSP